MLKKQIKKILKACGYTLYHTKTMPFGCDLKEDIARLSPDLNLRTIFDVGANKGQTTLDYRRKFPEAKIFCFEPVSQTFEVLKANVGLDPNVYCFNLALGEENKQDKILVQGTSGSNSISNVSKVNPSADQSLETVNIMTLDQFMAEDDHKIDQIDLLKIDTEGYECQVLRGAEATLRSEKIFYISIEVTFRQQDNHHTQFSTISEMLADYNFNFVGLYDASPFWGGGNAIDYGNALFKRWEKGKNLKLWE
ncbi:FkbM family methyltransferase [Nodularia spumigena]|jgi:FkbM family methyltransferase|uniref:FkbM family methyltransferase n=1 Tax=Nodularia spumigena UHCC 0060 TaxID=3110300 RepID=A0ABU5URZ3_NODSP|nr:FkbM family methyltransferase [Nodularia spumigena]MEA5525462.1 FkbM family methyltransferase [Nodularia spumigena UHCC 0143]MEA5608757.1 FkbM family methyltransferase [Nodularia spumigena UHCC 0060]MEA5615173.1 FkbM family methyltransferase [Nodularia spumigena UHCC 0040]